MPAAIASGVALTVLALARPYFDLIPSVALRLATGLGVLGGIHVALLLLLDRRWVGEIGELVRARWPHLAGSPRGTLP